MKRRGKYSNNKIIALLAITSLSIIGAAAFYPVDQIRVSAQQENNNNNNAAKISLSSLSTVVGTGADRYWSCSS